MADLERLKARAAEIAEKESKVLLDRTPGSKALHERALKSLPNGVASNFQAGDPYPVYLERGSGSRVWDVDGTEYTDFHGGFGVNVVGHAHPADRGGDPQRRGSWDPLRRHHRGDGGARRGDLLTVPAGADAVRQLGDRGHDGRPRVVARAATGRDKIIKMEGSYHGHHDSVLFSVVPEADVLDMRRGVDHEGQAWYTTEPTSKGVPRALWDTVIVVPFNDAEAVEEALQAHPGEVAAVILEPVMMNIGIVVPKPGYLQALRDACERHGAVLIYDEVKCGGTIAYGGTTERYGVKPHLAAYAKAVGGGATIGAFGGEARLMEWVTKGAAQQGTFNGNPLSVAAGLAALTKVLTKDAYDHLGKLGTMLAEGCQRAMDENDIPGHTMDLGAKGCVSFRKEPLANYRDFLETEPAFFYASFSWMINRGLFMTPGDEEQWTISVQHDEDDIRSYVEAFGGFCAELAG